MAGRLGPAADARHDGLLTATSAVSAAPMAGPMPVTPIPPSLAPTPSMAPTPGLASSAPSGPPAPMLEIRPSRFVFDGVYLNGLSSLRKFEIANISPFPLTVKLRSNLGRQVGFQLRNENLPDTPRRPSMLSPPPPAQPPPPPPPPLLAAADPATTAGAATVAAAATELVRRSMPLSTAVATATTSTAPSEIGESLTSSLESLLLTHMGGPSASAAAAAAATVASAIESKAGTMATVTMPAVAAAAAAAAAALAVASAAQPKLDSAPQQPSGRFLLDPISPEEWAVILPPTNTVAAASRARVHLERRAQREAAAQEIRRGSGNGGSGPSSYDEAAAAHASEEAAALAYGTQFNQLFNHVDLLDTVDLAPGECRTLVLSFLPDPTWRRNANAGNVTTTTTTNTSHPTLSTPSSRAQHHLENATSSSSSATPGVAITAPMGCAETAMDSEHDRSAGHDPRGRPPPALTAPPSTAVVAGTSVSTTQREAMMDPERKLDERIAEGDGQDPSDLHADFTDINGLLFFFAYCRRPPITTSPSAASLPTITAADSANEARSLVVSSPPNGPSASRGGTLAGDNTAVMTTAITNAASAAPDFTITAKFRSAVCRSILYSDIVDTGLVFDDCVAGQTYYKDFTLWNRSEIELFWSLELEAVAAPSQAPRRNDLLTILDYDTGEAMVCRSLAAFSPRRIRVMFRPGTATGEYKWELSMENIHDASNTLTAEITATVRTARRQESLIIASGDLIDFGDCVAGIEKTEILLLKNVSHTQLDVRFSSDYPGITFRMVDDELRPGAESGRHHESHDDHLHGRHSAHNVEDDDGSSGGHRHGRGEGSPGTTGGMHPHPSSLMQTGADAANTNSALVGGAYGPTGTAAATADGIGAATAAATTSGQATDDESLTASLSGRDPTNDGYPSEWMRPATSGTATQIEELTLRSHSRRVVQVCYCPLLAEQSGDPKLGRLTKQHARLVLNYNTQSGEPEKKVIQCKSRVCTSVIRVEPASIHFGDTDVGRLKSARVALINCADVAARVQLRVTSKILSCARHELTIPPRQRLETAIEIFPRKINPDYRKQITVVNLLNPRNELLIEVQANNIDKHRMTFHSLFYRIHTPATANFLDFGQMVYNAPALRTLTISNISKKALVLGFSAMANHAEEPGPDIMIYTPTVAGAAAWDRRRTLGGLDPAVSVATAAASDAAGVPYLAADPSDADRNVQQRRQQEQRKEQLLESIASKDRRHVKRKAGHHSHGQLSPTAADDEALSDGALVNESGHHLDGGAHGAFGATASSVSSGRRRSNRTSQRPVSARVGGSGSGTGGNGGGGIGGGGSGGGGGGMGLAGGVLASLGHASSRDGSDYLDLASHPSTVSGRKSPAKTREGVMAGLFSGLRRTDLRQALFQASITARTQTGSMTELMDDKVGALAPLPSGSVAGAPTSSGSGGGGDSGAGVASSTLNPNMTLTPSLSMTLGTGTYLPSVESGVVANDIHEKSRPGPSAPGSERGIIDSHQRRHLHAHYLAGPYAALSAHADLDSDTTDPTLRRNVSRYRQDTNARSQQTLKELLASSTAQMDLDALLRLYNALDASTLPLLAGMSEHDQVKAWSVLRRELTQLVETRLTPIDQIEVPPHKDIQIVVVYTPRMNAPGGPGGGGGTSGTGTGSTSGAASTAPMAAASDVAYGFGKSRKFDARLLVRLLAFDITALPHFDHVMHHDDAIGHPNDDSSTTTTAGGTGGSVPFSNSPASREVESFIEDLLQTYGPDWATNLAAIPLREIMMRGMVCRSNMDLGQKNINFGTLCKHEQRINTLVIRNHSESPLLYSIRKSGSIASGDMWIAEGGRKGVIREYGTKELEFVFQPSMTGPFHEKLVFENVQDPTNVQVLTVKALVKRTANFFVDSLDVYFGPCYLPRSPLEAQLHRDLATGYTVYHTLEVSNTSTKQRHQYEIRVPLSSRHFDGGHFLVAFYTHEEDQPRPLIQPGCGNFHPPAAAPPPGGTVPAPVLNASNDTVATTATTATSSLPSATLERGASVPSAMAAMSHTGTGSAAASGGTSSAMMRGRQRVPSTASETALGALARPSSSWTAMAGHSMNGAAASGGGNISITSTTATLGHASTTSTHPPVVATAPGVRKALFLLSDEAEEEIEHLEQKMKIAKRKGRPEKVEQLQLRIEQLRLGIPVDHHDDASGLTSPSPLGDLTTTDASSAQGNAAGLASTATTTDSHGAAGGGGGDSGGNANRLGTSTAVGSGVSSDTASKVATTGSSKAANGAGGTASEAMVSKAAAMSLVMPPILVRKTEDSIIVQLEPRAICHITIVLTAVLTDNAANDTTKAVERASTVEPASTTTTMTPYPSEIMDVSGAIEVQEFRNRDNSRSITFHVSLCRTPDAYLSRLAQTCGGADNILSPTIRRHVENRLRGQPTEFSLSTTLSPRTSQASSDLAGVRESASFLSFTDRNRSFASNASSRINELASFSGGHPSVPLIDGGASITSSITSDAVSPSSAAAAALQRPPVMGEYGAHTTPDPFSGSTSLITSPSMRLPLPSSVNECVDPRSSTSAVSAAGVARSDVTSPLTTGYSTATMATPISTVDTPLASRPIVIRAKLELSHVDLGRGDIAERRACYFTLTNPSSTHVLPVECWTTCGASAVDFADRMVLLQPSETRRIHLHIQPPKPGYHRFSIRYRSLELDPVTGSPIASPRPESHDAMTGYASAEFTILGVRATYLAFPLLHASATEMDLGLIYVEQEEMNRTSKIVEWPIQNVTTDPILVSGSSNLSQQCIVYADEELRHPLTLEPLRPGQIKMVWIALQPYLSSSASASNPSGAQPVKLTSSSTAKDMDATSTSTTMTTSSGGHPTSGPGGAASTTGVMDGTASSSHRIESAVETLPVYGVSMGMGGKSLHYASSAGGTSRSLIGGLRFQIYDATGMVPPPPSSTTPAAAKPADEMASAASESMASTTTPMPAPTLLITQILRFKAIIGHTCLGISDPVVHLGRCQLKQPTVAQFTLSNWTVSMPLHYAITSDSPLITFLPEIDSRQPKGPQQEQGSGGNGDGLTTPSTTTALTPVPTTCRGILPPAVDSEAATAASKRPGLAVIRFTFTPDVPGLHAHTIEISNLHHHTSPERMTVLAFVDPDAVVLAAAPSMGSGTEAVKASSMTPTTSEHGYPLLHWRDAYLVKVPLTMPSDSAHAAAATAAAEMKSGWALQHVLDRPAPDADDQTVALENRSDEALTLYGFSDRHISIPPSSEGGDALAKTDNAVNRIRQMAPWAIHFPTFGGAVVLPPRGRRIVRVRLAAPHVADAALLESGQTLRLTGHLVWAPAVGPVAAMVALVQEFGLSKLELSTRSVHLGRVGHCQNWVPQPFTVDVRNVAEIPLYYALETPPGVTIHRVGGVAIDSSDETRLRDFLRQHPVAGYGAHTVEGTYTPSMADPVTQMPLEGGPGSTHIRVINMGNPAASIALAIKYHLTVFQLQFERLDANNALVLPPLHYLAQPPTPSDNWFTILNATADETRFRMGATLPPDVGKYVQLEILSRFSNSPLSSGPIILQPFAAIEVRIRAFARNNVRLTKDNTHAHALLNPDGIRLGTLWMSCLRDVADTLSSPPVPINAAAAQTANTRVVSSLSEQLTETRAAATATAAAHDTITAMMAAGAATTDTSEAPRVHRPGASESDLEAEALDEEQSTTLSPTAVAAPTILPPAVVFPMDAQIPVRGRIVHGQSFKLSTSSLQFGTACASEALASLADAAWLFSNAQTFRVTNLLPTFELTLQLRWVYPVEIGHEASPIFAVRRTIAAPPLTAMTPSAVGDSATGVSITYERVDETLTVPAGSSVDLEITLIKPLPGLSEDIQLIFTDACGLMEQAWTLYLSIDEEYVAPVTSMPTTPITAAVAAVAAAATVNAVNAVAAAATGGFPEDEVGAMSAFDLASSVASCEPPEMDTTAIPLTLLAHSTRTSPMAMPSELSHVISEGDLATEFSLTAPIRLPGRDSPPSDAVSPDNALLSNVGICLGNAGSGNGTSGLGGSCIGPSSDPVPIVPTPSSRFTSRASSARSSLTESRLVRPIGMPLATVNAAATAAVAASALTAAASMTHAGVGATMSWPHPHSSSDTMPAVSWIGHAAQAAAQAAAATVGRPPSVLVLKGCKKNYWTRPVRYSPAAADDLGLGLGPALRHGAHGASSTPMAHSADGPSSLINPASLFYELTLGQQDLQSPPAVRKITLEQPPSHANDPIHYRIRILSALDKAWLHVALPDDDAAVTFSAAARHGDGVLALNQKGGIAAPPGEKVHLYVTCTLAQTGVYLTYLMIENVQNAADTKIIRITMEVVAKQQIRPRHPTDRAGHRSSVAQSVAPYGYTSAGIPVSAAVTAPGGVSSGDSVSGSIGGDRSSGGGNSESVSAVARLSSAAAAATASAASVSASDKSGNPLALGYHVGATVTRLTLPDGTPVRVCALEALSSPRHAGSDRLDGLSSSSNGSSSVGGGTSVGSGTTGTGALGASGAGVGGGSSSSSSSAVTSSARRGAPTAFTVIASGSAGRAVAPGAASMVMHDVFFDHEHSAASLLIHNNEMVPLDFSIKADLGKHPMSEVLVSLTRDSTTLFRSLVVEPQSDARIYVSYYPCADEDGLRPTTLQQANAVVMRRFTLSVNCRIIKDYEHVVQAIAYCRHPQMRVARPTVAFHGRPVAATAAAAAASVPPPPFADLAGDAFWGAVSAEMPPARPMAHFHTQPSRLFGDEYTRLSGWDIHWSEANAGFDVEGTPVEHVVLENVLDEPLAYMVMNDTRFFLCETPVSPAAPSVASLETAPPGVGLDGSVVDVFAGTPTAAALDPTMGIDDFWGRPDAAASGPAATTPSSGLSAFNSISMGTVPGRARVALRIQPNVAEIRSAIDVLRREKYVVEHLVIYNRHRLSEKYVVTLRLSFGHHANFQTASISKAALASLEHQTVQFLRAFRAFAARPLPPSQASQDPAAEPDASRASRVNASLASDELGHPTSPRPSTRGRGLASETSRLTIGRRALVDPVYADLFVQYTYLVDQLIFLGTREQASDVCHPLASLLFHAVLALPHFRHAVALGTATASLLPSPLAGRSQMDGWMDAATTSPAGSAFTSASPAADTAMPLPGTSVMATASSAMAATATATSLVTMPITAAAWVDKLRTFLAFFPGHHTAIVQLRELARSLNHLASDPAGGDLAL